MQDEVQTPNSKTLIPEDFVKEGQLPSSLIRGIDVLKKELETIPSTPGVYRMLDAQKKPLYIGKAKHLHKRVTSYTQVNRLNNRLQAMVSQVVSVEITTTHTEAEALLLECNLIKHFRPFYNVALRDDKSFPFIRLDKASSVEEVEGEKKKPEMYPRLSKFRGTKEDKALYYGPFASASSVNRTLLALEKAFLLRSCKDSDFRMRQRPCLLYDIKRCSAPCVGKISSKAYTELVQDAKDFLSGESSSVQKRLAERMEKASNALEFEKAAFIRDRIKALTAVQARQDINLQDLTEADVIAAYEAGGRLCVQVFFYRSGRNYGNHAYFPSRQGLALEEVLSSFIGQFYTNKPVPKVVLVSHTLEERALLEQALSLKADRKIQLLRPQRGAKTKLMEHALSNAKEALGRRLAEQSAQSQLMKALSETLNQHSSLTLKDKMERIEIYDNSHIQGTHAVGCMVVMGAQGWMKGAYRRFHIKHEETRPGDDYGMMREVFFRRFSRAQKEDPTREKGQWPDLVLIDGGKGQLSVVQDTLAELGIEDVSLVAVAKGPDRHAGREQLFFSGEKEPLQLEKRDPVLYFIQRLRDEAHRYAIMTHRARRQKAAVKSILDGVPLVGPKRKKALLRHFGSAEAVRQAGLDDLEAVEGISKTVAQTLYGYFHA